MNAFSITLKTNMFKKIFILCAFAVIFLPVPSGFSVYAASSGSMGGSFGSSWKEREDEEEKIKAPAAQPASQKAEPSSQIKTTPHQGPHTIELPKNIAQEAYNEGKQAADNKDYAKALKLFNKANENEPNNPDILNMLAFTQRKLGDIDSALANYDKALSLRPDFAQAREYLSEAYIQAALAEIKKAKAKPENAGLVQELAKAFKESADNIDKGEAGLVFNTDEAKASQAARYLQLSLRQIDILRKYGQSAEEEFKDANEAFTEAARDFTY